MHENEPRGLLCHLGMLIRALKGYLGAITWSKDLANGSCDALAENESERVEEEEISGGGAAAGSVGAAAACSSSNQLNKDGGRQERVSLQYLLHAVLHGGKVKWVARPSHFLAMLNDLPREVFSWKCKLEHGSSLTWPAAADGQREIRQPKGGKVGRWGCTKSTELGELVA